MLDYMADLATYICTASRNEWQSVFTAFVELSWELKAFVAGITVWYGIMTVIGLIGTINVYV